MADVAREGESGPRLRERAPTTEGSGKAVRRVATEPMEDGFLLEQEAERFGREAEASAVEPSAERQ